MRKNNYYQKKIFIPQVNKNDEIIGKIERWDAHKKGILHRGFTTIIKLDDKFLVQHRKHLVFDNVFDLSFSSHPHYEDNKLTSIEDCIIKSLNREWVFDGKIEKIIFLNKYYYKEKDKNSEFTEHEINYLYLIKIKGQLGFNENFCYNFKSLDKKIIIKTYQIENYAPWIKKISYNDLKKFLS